MLWKARDAESSALGLMGLPFGAPGSLRKASFPSLALYQAPTILLRL